MEGLWRHGGLAQSLRVAQTWNTCQSKGVLIPGSMSIRGPPLFQPSGSARWAFSVVSSQNLRAVPMKYPFFKGVRNGPRHPLFGITCRHVQQSGRLLVWTISVLPNIREYHKGPEHFSNPPLGADVARQSLPGWSVAPRSQNVISYP